ncbi:MAG: flagellar motor protein MotB [Sulfitobacter sp.]
MEAQKAAAPVIIKRKKVIAGGGHHGGAWKVAYADFVTAMMAFFMLMWLLNATTEQQRKGIADYFAPTIAINRISGGGSGAFGGDSVFSEETLAQNGTGATAQLASEEQQNRGESNADDASGDKSAEDEAFRVLQEMLLGRGGESMVMENALEHINSRITDEGLVIELFALENAPLFAEGGTEPTQLLQDLTTLIAEVSKTVSNNIAVGGHVRASPIVLANRPVWDLSADRATRTRELLEARKIGENRVQRVTGHADREPVTRNPMAPRNDRLEIVLLRRL